MTLFRVRAGVGAGSAAGVTGEGARYGAAMRAIFATGPNPDDPLSMVRVGERPEPDVSGDWVRVAVRAASINRHDLWTLRGVGIRTEEFPMILGCDGAGVTEDGREVVIYPVIADPAAVGAAGDETLDPGRRLLTEGGHQGCMAEYVAVPARNTVAKPAGMSFEQAATLGTTYLTAYRMLFTRSGLAPGSTVLVQGATGGVATALIQLGAAAGMRVWATARTEAGRARAETLGAAATFEAGARLPERVDGVFESVGAATWAHSMKVVRPGGVVVCCGATTGADPSADLQRLFFRQISVVGSTMGTLDEMQRLIAFCDAAGVVPMVDKAFPLAEGAAALEEVEHGSAGKVVVTV
jgi:NADPH:quinone reductase-like Zn-dependent oxidoreductase